MSEEQAPEAAADPFSGNAMLDQASIDELLKQAIFEAPGAGDGSAGESSRRFPTPPNLNFPISSKSFRTHRYPASNYCATSSSMSKSNSGRARMLVEDVLRLAEGSVVELDKLAGDPVDVFVNDRLVARGEVLVLNDNFCVRVNEISPG